MSQAASSTSSSEGRPTRRLLLAGLAASLGGCGFRPLNGPPAAGEADIAPQLAAVRLGRSFGRSGQLLHQALDRRLAARDRSGPPARYELVVSPSPAYEIQGYRRDGSPSRFRMVLTAPWTLQTLSVPPRPVANGVVRAIDSYNFIDNEFFASLVSSEAAERRLVEQVAEEVVLRLAMAFRDNPAA
ncbi:LPS assembly lipoprotein LptE [Roseomonas sp. WA12]